jgi:succinoglycan biosynthesis protein ExoL
MRGRPARDVLPEFEAIVAANPDLAFAGPYRNPEDLGAIYGTVHLVWAIDRFEAGGNSDWLLPNRLYEGCLHRAIPLALEGTETARAVAARGIGIVLEGMDPQRLGARLGAVTQAEIATAQAAITACGVESWRASARDARALVASLARPDTAPAARPVIAPPERPAA